MDAAAVVKIQESQAITSANAQIPTNINHRVVVLPSDFKTHDLEKYFPSRERFHGDMSTKSIDAFASYAAEHSESGASTFIDAKAMAAKLIINFGIKELPGHCDNTAVVALEKTAPYKALLGINEKRISQKEAAEFIEDWRAYLTAQYEENEAGECESMSIVKALHAVRKITIEASARQESDQRNFGATTTSMESIDVKSQDTPPTYLTFTCDPYAGLPPRRFVMRLSIITDKVPQLILRIVRAEEHIEEMAREFQAIIESKLTNITPEIKTYVGVFTH